MKRFVLALASGALLMCSSACGLPSANDVTGLHFTTSTTNPSNPPPDIDVSVTDPTPARAIYSATIGLPDTPGGVYHCPNDSGLRYDIDFEISRGDDVTAVISPTGCDDVVISASSTRRALDSAYYETLAQNLGVPFGTLYPYAPAN